MYRLLINITGLVCLCAASALHAETTQSADEVDDLKEPLYTPFVERYVLDELKHLRTDMAAQKHELMQQILDREHNSVDRGVAYATDTVTYFFYLIAGATSILVLVGWTSIREIKERVHSLADEEISRLVREYEQRLIVIEKQLNQKSQHIRKNREEIELTQEIQSLWLRAGQESSVLNKISIYDQILKLRPGDIEALTYKADAVLEMGEPQWAVSLANQALEIDADNSHAFYQLACASAAMKQYDDAVSYLREALDRRDSFKEDIVNDPALSELRDHQAFKEMMQQM